MVDHKGIAETLLEGLRGHIDHSSQEKILRICNLMRACTLFTWSQDQAIKLPDDLDEYMGGTDADVAEQVIWAGVKTFSEPHRKAVLIELLQLLVDELQKAALELRQRLIN